MSPIEVTIEDGIATVCINRPERKNPLTFESYAELRDMFRALADRGINIQAITTSEIKVSVMIDEDETELAVRVLHTAYGLDAEDAA